MVELIDRQYRAVERFRCELLKREPQCRMRANQRGIRAFKELNERSDLTLRGTRVAEVMFVLDLPVCKETVRGQLR